MMKQNCQLSSDCGDSAFLGATTAASSELQAPSPEICIWAQWAEDVMRSLDQQSSQVFVSCSGDTQARSSFT